MPKYIFITGGVMSGVGKGIVTASIGRVLIDKGYKVTAIKIDPYVNVDAGTMNPVEHGEVFVTNDGLECDQDVGNYERFLDDEIFKESYITTGKVYQNVINKERNLEYNGRCVEVVPDIPNEAISIIKKAGKKKMADFVLVEIGGTVGEYQNMIFLEASRMMKLSNPKDVLFVLVSYLPVPKVIGEMKTKPTQYAVRTLNSAGIQPDFVVARSAFPLDDIRKKKISVFCNISPKDIVSSPDVESIYEVPNILKEQKVGERILRKLNLKSRKNLIGFENLVDSIKKAEDIVKIGIVGKYFGTGSYILADSYISVIEAVKHASYFYKKKPEIHWISAEEYEKNPKKLKELKKMNGVIVPGGFGTRGVEGKIKAIEYCRRNEIPFLGICLGMQLIVVEFIRNVCGIKKANSTEFDINTDEPVVDIIEKQKSLLKDKKYGGTMRLGAYLCRLEKDTKVRKIYNNKEEIFERHRHRYEINNKYVNTLKNGGLTISGINPENNLVEIVEIKKHPFFTGVQFHPEFKSKPLDPHPLFREFIKSSLNKKK